MSKLIDLRVGETIKVGDVAAITLIEKSGKLARLSIVADSRVKIDHVKVSASRLARMGLTVAA